MENLREYTLKIVRSKRREMVCSGFTVGKGTAGSMERWYLYTHENEYYGDSLEDVVEQASKDYWNIHMQLPELKEA